MKRTILAVCGACVMASLAISLSASVQQPPSITPQASIDGASVTITGCLKAADAAPVAGRTATDIKLAAATGSPKYVLTNVERNASKSPSSATDTVGTSGTTAGATLQASYGLVPDTTVNLETHLNHKVEIVGTLDKVEPAGRMTDATKTQPQQNPPAIGTSGKTLPTIKVKSLRMVAATCM